MAFDRQNITNQGIYLLKRLKEGHRLSFTGMFTEVDAIPPAQMPTGGGVTFAQAETDTERFSKGVLWNVTPTRTLGADGKTDIRAVGRFTRAQDSEEFVMRSAYLFASLVDTEGHVGWGGITTNAYDGSLATPEGVFGLGFAFGIKEDPGTRMEYRLVDKYDYWVGDQDSEYYNQWVDIRETGKVWVDDTYTEHLIDFTIPYAYSIFIQYNWPVQKDLPQNCAIFLHCIGNVATAGCVSIPEKDMVTILRAIDPEGAVIVIANGDDVYKY